jgi:cytochrome c oxidase subunit 4
MKSAHLSRKACVLVWAALMLLLFLTWGIAQFDLGPFNNIVALGIAITKMMLVVLFFMHARNESPLTWIFVAAGVIWFVIMIDLTLADYLTRTGPIHQVRELPAD